MKDFNHSVLPLTFAQQRLFFLHQLEPHNSAHNVSVAVLLEGKLDRFLLDQSLQEIVCRHEALRTNIIEREGEQTQTVRTSSTFGVDVVDMQYLSLHKDESTIYSALTDEAQHRFNLSTDLLVRAKLLLLSETEAILQLTIHHIVSDGLSLSTLFEEIAILYSAFRQGQPSPLPMPSIRYSDFVIHQRQKQNVELQSHVAYWYQQLEGADQLLKLPTDRPRPSVRSFHGAHHFCRLSNNLTQRLISLSRTEGVTLFTILLSAFDVLLYRYSRQTDFVVGSPITARNKAGTKGLVGYFINILPLRVDLSDNPSFRSLLKNTQRMLLEASTHQEVQLERLIETLKIERNQSHTPLFQVMFTLNPPSPLTQHKLPDVDWQEIHVENFAAAFDLSLSMSLNSNSLTATWEYSTDLFDEGTIARISRHFQHLLEVIATQPEHSIDQLPILPEADIQKMLVDWNNNTADYSIYQCIHQIFEAQVQRTPDDVAVVFGLQQLTYQELNNKANQLAHYLQELGVKAEVLVGICVERSLEMIIGLLGILKAGGAYVPLDHTYPASRLQLMLADAKVSILLTQQNLSKLLRSLNVSPPGRLHLLCLDSDWHKIASASVKNPITDVTPENLIYVIYTSGSTGQPKGVMNIHSSLANRLLWMQQAYSLTPLDRVLQKTPFSFDVSVWEFFWPLIVGARLVIARPEGHRDSQYLIQTILQHKITTVHFVPSMLTTLLQEKEVKSLNKCLKRVICSGEALSLALQRTFFTQLDCELHNLYGPTEAAIDVTAWHCQPGPEHSVVPIGRPISNTQLYVLDTNCQPVPIGVPGELFISGVGLARGYLNLPELTSKKFINNPFGSGRLYKTGDLARYRSDGNLEFLGRIDHQVKLRGFRIELGEIESAITRQPTVQQCVATVQEREPGLWQLIAYVVVNLELIDPESREEILVTLKNSLKKELPEYMVPSAIVPLKALPLTPNGKIDRKALPVPKLELSGVDGFVAPRTARQKVIAQQFAETLSLPMKSIGLNDSFFDLGGHSLLTGQLVSRLKNAIGINVPLRVLFESPSVIELDKALEYLSQRDETKVSEVYQASILPKNILPAGEASLDQRNTPREVLITGSTGMLGAYLLRELLDYKHAYGSIERIYCLVRAQSQETALERIKSNLQRYSLWRFDEERLVPVVGDLSQPQMGISKSVFEQLARRVDAIYHNGAKVSFTESFTKLRDVNVCGTLSVIELACMHRAKPIHFISSAGVFLDCKSDKTIPEKFLTEDADIPWGGYERTKWVAERLLEQAQSKGLPVMVYRPATILAASDSTAREPIKDALSVISSRSLRVQKFPQLSSGWIDWIYVDHLASRIVTLSMSEKAVETAYAMNHPYPISYEELVRTINEVGYPVKLVDYDEWRETLQEYAKDQEDEELNTFLALLYEVTGTGRRWLEAVLDRPRMENVLADRLLKPGAQNPPLDRKFVVRILMSSLMILSKKELKRQSTESFDQQAIDILLVYGNAGSGHRAAASMLEEELRQRTSDNNKWKIQSIAIDDFSPLAQQGSRIYKYMTEFYAGEQGTDILHDLENQMRSDISLEYREYQSELAKVISQYYQPRLVVSLMASASELIAYWPTEVRKMTVVIDVVDDCLLTWSNQSINRVICPTQQVADFLIKKGRLQLEQLEITGPLLRSVPSESDCELAWKEQGLDPSERHRSEPLLLYFTEGRLERMDFLEETLQKVEPQQCPRIGILTYAVPEVRMRVDNLMNRKGYTIYPINWTNHLSAFLSAADAVYCKPGPGVALQSLFLGTEIFLDATQPWMRQERRLAHLLCQHDYAYPITNARSLGRCLRLLEKTESRVVRSTAPSDIEAFLSSGLNTTVNAILEELALTV